MACTRWPLDLDDVSDSISPTWIGVVERECLVVLIETKERFVDVVSVKDAILKRSGCIDGRYHILTIELLEAARPKLKRSPSRWFGTVTTKQSLRKGKCSG